MLTEIMQWAFDNLVKSVEIVKYNEAASQWKTERINLLNCYKKATNDLLVLLRSQQYFKEGVRQDYWIDDSFVVLSARTVQWCKENKVSQYEVFIQHQGALDGANGIHATSKESPYFDEWKKWYGLRQSILNLKPQ